MHMSYKSAIVHFYFFYSKTFIIYENTLNWFIEIPNDIKNYKKDTKKIPK